MRRSEIKGTHHQRQTVNQTVKREQKKKALFFSGVCVCASKAREKDGGTAAPQLRRQRLCRLSAPPTLPRAGKSGPR